MSDSPKRLRVLFSGRVQGVGFRYTVQVQCTRIGVGGWVRNLRDGRVEAVLEGSAELLDQAVAQIEAERRSFITRTWTEALDPGPGGNGTFRIERDA